MYQQIPISEMVGFVDHRKTSTWGLMTFQPMWSSEIAKKVAA